MTVNTISRFAFVEYESRRDADDAYHEMHNTRLGRDDLLKIEVRRRTTPPPPAQRPRKLAEYNPHSGLVLLHLHPGDLTLVVTVVQVTVVPEAVALLVVADLSHLLAEVAVTILLARTIVASATTSDGTVTDRDLRMIGIEK